MHGMEWNVEDHQSQSNQRHDYGDGQGRTAIAKMAGDKTSDDSDRNSRDGKNDDYVDRRNNVRDGEIDIRCID
jgi:hypothetical protein